MSHQDEVIKALKTSIEQGSLPHLLFHGPPGTGKTTTVLAVARALYGPELYKQRTLELNASDERGISVVREKIKTFAQGAVGGQKTPGYPCPRFKLIILDEADTMTPDAQSALRRIMENYSKVTRFCLCCNYVTRIIEPLGSRCSKFRFKTLPQESMVDRLNYIARCEQVQLGGGSLEAIMKASGGDMRKAVTYLQSAHQLCGGAGFSITPETVTDISCQVPSDIMGALWTKMGGASYEQMRLAVADIVSEAYPMTALLSQLHDDTVRHPSLSDLDKALVCEKIAHADQCLVDGSSELLQLLDVASFVMRRFAAETVAADNRIDPH